MLWIPDNHISLVNAIDDAQGIDPIFIFDIKVIG